jgi:hypothetical protein
MVIHKIKKLRKFGTYCSLMNKDGSWNIVCNPKLISSSVTGCSRWGGVTCKRCLKLRKKNGISKT